MESAAWEMLWAKTNAVGRPHSLIGHLLDSAAVAELLWDGFLARKVQSDLNNVSGGRGRDLLVLLAGFHDLGKATPAFQWKALRAGLPELMEPLARLGLKVDRAHASAYAQWPHGLASGVIFGDVAVRHQMTGWLWAAPLLEGHHGYFPRHPTRLKPQVQYAQGTGPWIEAQQSLADVVARRIGVALEGWVLATPSRGIQLALAGFVVMADWIASSDLFPGVGVRDMSMETARGRAGSAWARLGLVRGWNERGLAHGTSDFESRFGNQPRPLQRLVVDSIAAVDPLGMLLIEAPMGEGKTEAAEFAAELLGRSCGASGIVFAMPTQGTTDAMYTRVVQWMRAVDPDVAVSLLHGKAMLNEGWRELVEGVRVTGVFGGGDEFGLPEEYGDASHKSPPAIAPLASTWLMGRHRGLLSPAVVATIDQVLWAATRTKFVSLRHAGLAGRILVIDEVHTYDAYMSVFLHELLRWCARGGVPVVVMSATLAPSVRQALMSSWCAGKDLEPVRSPGAPGYPSVLSISTSGRIDVRTCQPHKPDQSVSVEVLPGDDPEDVSPVVAAVGASLIEGGCALVIVNTVARAQEIYQRLAASGDEALLIHGRLTAAERARRTSRALDLMGVAGTRPQRLIVVATQIAEQSFDVDADVLFTDLAPMDLLLQRVGRLHRHSRPKGARPASLRQPRVVVTGLAWRGGMPVWPSAFAVQSLGPVPRPGDRPRTVYRPRPLLATAAQLRERTVWAIPSQVPSLVAQAYDDDWSGPEEWSVAVSLAALHEEAERAAREAAAQTYRLDIDPRTAASTLSDLHRLSSGADEQGPSVVRDGDETVEVCLVRHDGAQFRTLSGRPLGVNAERAAACDVAREILGDSVRLRFWSDLSGLRPLPQWAGSALLSDVPVVVLDAQGCGIAGARSVRYDNTLGLVRK